jgi:hypothetical protein
MLDLPRKSPPFDSLRASFLAKDARNGVPAALLREF